MLDLTSLSAFTDYFVIATADNDRQLNALVDYVDRACNELDPPNPVRREGDAEGGWVLLDLGGVIVHLFSLEQRARYNLEGLWSKAQEVVRVQ